MQRLSEEKQLEREKLICEGKREIDLNDYGVSFKSFDEISRCERLERK